MKKFILAAVLCFCGFTVEAAAQTEGPMEAIRLSIRKSLALMQSSAVVFTKKSGCISCHHQSLTAMAVSTARRRGLPVNEQIAVQQVKATMAVLSPHRETLLQGMATIPATSIVSSYALVGLAAEGYEPDEATDVLAIELADRQWKDGRWHGESQRPPLDQGEITSTAFSLRALQLYAPPGRSREFRQRVARAGQWLASAKASTTQEKSMRLMGLSWAGEDAGRIVEAAMELASAQRPDGGWAQLPALESDAYATGQVLVALYESGAVQTSDDVYQRGVRFLLKTQKEDGSWHVKSRALGFQKYFESGYPYGPDQWISSAGAGWATMALALAVEPARLTAGR